MRELKVRKVREGAVLPARATVGSAGADLYACLEAPLPIKAGERAAVPVGVAVEIPPGWAGFVFGRSGLGLSRGIVPANAVGVIDSDYRGELAVPIANYGDEEFLIQPGDRIAQLVLMPVAIPEIVECDSLSDTARDAGGFGSTGL